MKTIEVDGSLESGWATIVLRSKDQEHSITTSYVFDGLENLLSSLVLLNQGIKETECSLIDEPGAHLLHFLSNSRSSLVITCYFTKRWNKKPLNEMNGEAEKICEIECSLLQFSKQMVLLFDKWEAKYSREGYQVRWRHPFPIAMVEKLKAFNKKHLL